MSAVAGRDHSATKETRATETRIETTAALVTACDAVGRPTNDRAERLHERGTLDAVGHG